MKPTSLIFAAFVGFLAYANGALAVSVAPAPFSQYGQIQSVKNYSSNPFWSKDSPYNARFPTPIYATGADLNTGDCNSIVEVLVSSYCAEHNYCERVRLNDARPSLMVQLSQMPGHNYATSCGGYIDSAFEKYKNQRGNTSTNNVITPATHTTTTNNTFQNTIQLKNPYAIKPTAYQQGVAERTAELKSLQAQNAPTPEVVAADFPKTFADLSLTDRMANLAEGYEPYKDKKSFRTITIESDEDFLERLRVVNSYAYCQRIMVPENDPTCKAKTEENQTPTSDNNDTPHSNAITEEDQIRIDNIVTILNPQNKDEETFFRDLATAYVAAWHKNPDVILDKNFIYDFLGTGDNLDKYRRGLLGLTDIIEDEAFGISIDWDEVLLDISIVLDNAEKQRGMKVCENNRSLQVGLDVMLWVGTAVAAIFTFGGAAGAAIGARVAVGAGLKALAKGAAKIGAKKIASKLTLVAGKQLAKTGMTGGAKAIVKQTTKRAIKKIGKNLATKKTLYVGSGLAVAYIGLGVAKRHSGIVYSLFVSDASTEILNCQDLDHNEGCYTVCGDGIGNDDLNTKVFQPVLGKKYCVNPEDYAMYELKSNGQTGDVMVFKDEHYPKLRQALNSIKDTGKCDWNEDDIDAFIGYYIYDPDTLEISKDALYVDDMVRIDD
ncbi:MAG: hypothetical protein J6T57_00615 [Alphaproteobacteria bacterium]|nr:hypothetical protein [Alphaproteobacteria bacterium]